MCTILEQTENDEPTIIGIQLNQLKRIPLSCCIQQLQSIRDALANGDYDKVIRLRGRGFEDNINIYRILNKLDPVSKKKPVSSITTYIIEILIVGKR